MNQSKSSPAALLVQAVLALVASALLLLLALVVSVEYARHGEAVRDELAIPGKSLQVVYGSGEAVGDALEITGYQAGEDGLVAIAARRGEFSAEDFPLLHYGLDVHNGTGNDQPKVELLWRLAGEPETIKTLTLGDTDAGSAWMNLAGNPEWRGEVVEIGIYVTADDNSQTLTLSQLTFSPRSWRGVLSSLWHDWTQYRGWSVRSINYLYGSVDTASVSPVEVATAWAALAVVLLWITGRARGGAVVIAVLLTWVALDLLWQNELDTQLDRTRQQFGGKSQEEKHLADLDADIYRYIQHLKRDVLPAQVSRIVILHDSWGHNFDRLRAQYYLLPNNSFNFGHVPPAEQLHNVDYVLVLGEVPELEFRAGTGSLVWKLGRRRLYVERVDSDPAGSLYRVIHADRSGKGKTS